MAFNPNAGIQTVLNASSYPSISKNIMRYQLEEFFKEYSTFSYYNEQTSTKYDSSLNYLISLQGNVSSMVFGNELQIPIKCTFPLNYPQICPYIVILPPNGYQLCSVPFMEGYQVLTDSIRQWKNRQESSALNTIFAEITMTFNTTSPVAPKGNIPQKNANYNQNINQNMMQNANYNQQYNQYNNYNPGYNHLPNKNPAVVDDSTLRGTLYQKLITNANSQYFNLSTMVDELGKLEMNFILEEGKLKIDLNQLKDLKSKSDLKLNALESQEKKNNVGKITKENAYTELGPSDENRNLLFAIIAKIKALDDALYILRKSYEEKAISLQDLLDGIKTCSRKQFYAKYKCQKIISQNLIKTNP